jgi:hypothetical protein
MRKPRVVIFNYSGSSVYDLMTLFRNRGYDIFVVTEYVNVICPICGIQENKTCACPLPCCDVMVVSKDGERIKGVDLFNRQSQLGCKLTPVNKAIIKSSFVRDKLDDIIYKDTNIFVNPLNLHEFETWVKDCEGRIDLSQRLAVIRREDRYACRIPIQLRLMGEDVYISAQAVNASTCGICLRISRPIERGREIQFSFQNSGDVDEGIVQWVKKLENGRYLIGVTLCV